MSVPYEGKHRCESGRFYDELVWVLVTYCGRHRARTGFPI